MFRKHPQKWKALFSLLRYGPGMPEWNRIFFLSAVLFFFLIWAELQPESLTSFYYSSSSFFCKCWQYPLLHVTALRAGNPVRKGLPMCTLHFKGWRKTLTTITEERYGEDLKKINKREQEWDKKCYMGNVKIVTYCEHPQIDKVA